MSSHSFCSDFPRNAFVGVIIDPSTGTPAGRPPPQPPPPGRPASSLLAAARRLPSPTAGKQVSSTPGSRGCGSGRHTPPPGGYLGAGHCRLPSPTRWPSIPPPAARQHASHRQEGLAFPGSLPTGSGFRSPRWPPSLRRSSWVRATTDARKHASARGPVAQGTGPGPPPPRACGQPGCHLSLASPLSLGASSQRATRVASTAPSLGRHSATRAAAASPHPSPRNRASLRLPKALPTRTPPSFRRVHPNPESDSAPRPTLGLSLSPRWENTLAPATDTACPRRERHTRPRVLCRSLTSGPLTCPWGQGLRPESGSAGPGPGAPMGTPALHPCYPQHALRTPGKTQTLLLDPPGPQGPWSLCETPQGRTSP